MNRTKMKKFSLQNKSSQRRIQPKASLLQNALFIPSYTNIEGVNMAPKFVLLEKDLKN